jgi:protein TonB
MIDLAFPNVVIYSTQVLCVVMVAAAGAWLLPVPAAHVRYWYWRAVVATCVVLPLAGRLLPARTAAPLPNAGTISDTVESIGTLTANPQSMSSFVPFVVWLLIIGVGFRLLRLGAGLFRLRRLRRQSTPMMLDDEVDVLRRGLAFGTQVKTHPAVRQPIAFGFRRPIVLLPESFPTLSSDTQRVVACHELLHVQRGDWLSTLGEEVLRAIFWFHPAMRWALTRVQLTREELVDARVVELTGARRAYMNALLTFANSPPLSLATLFGRRHQVAARIRRLAEEVHMSRLRLNLTAAALATVLAASTWAVAAAMPMRGEPSGESGRAITTIGREVRVTLAGPTLRKPITQVDPQYPVDLLRSGVGARVTFVATISALGQVVEILEPKWQLTLSETSTIDDVPGFWARKPWLAFIEAAQAAVRQWSFEPGEATATEMTIVFKAGGDVTMFAPAPPPPPPPPPDARSIDQARESLATKAAALAQSLEGLRQAAQPSPLQGTIRVAPGSDVPGGAPQGSTQVQGTLRPVPGSETPGVAPRSAAPPPPPPPPPPARTTPPGVYRVGAGINAPVKIKDVRPIYPSAAQSAGIQGVVILEVQIAEDGTVANALVVRSIPLLDDAALEAVHQWAFTPTLLNGAPISVMMMVTVNFTLAP